MKREKKQTNKPKRKKIKMCNLRVHTSPSPFPCAEGKVVHRLCKIPNHGLSAQRNVIRQSNFEVILPP